MKKEKLESKLSLRPPIVAVLGHVDCGKTSLLDFIRKIAGKAAPTNRGEPRPVAGREVGGITQSIGAYQVDFKGKKITFIDTPGHAAFAQMRARGGQVADLVILVVAADDGVMPQTLESIEHIKAAAVPYLVAINKIDLAGVDPEKVKKQLADNGVLVEGYGGQVVALPISAKTGQGIEELLEMIILLAEMQEISGDPQGLLQGVVIESKKDKAGSVATVIIKNGTLKIGEQILAEGVLARVKGLIDENKRRREKLGPGEAAEVLGFESPPPVGSEIIRVEVGTKPTSTLIVPKVPKFTEEEEKKLKIILKVDSAGLLEALTAHLPQDVLLVSAGIGDIWDSDVLLAQVLKAKIFGFRVKISPDVAKLAESEKVQIKTYEIIYQFLEDLEKEILKRQEPIREEKILGKAVIIAEFFVGGSRIAGCRVTEGKISQSNTVRLKRGEKLIGETRIASLQQKSKPISEVKAKEEFGVLLSPLLDFKVDDVLVSFAFQENE